MKKYIYFPSFSSGLSGVWLGKNKPMLNGFSTRFYNKNDVPPEWHHPYFLLSAGHNYKKFNIRKDWGLDNCLVIGDSGGYQIATGALPWSNKLRETLFKWLENNSDYAINLDIPPFGIYDGRFEESLKISKENFKYFADNQSGKTKFLNVLHGNTEKQIQHWFDNVKHFDFSGWSVGSSSSSRIKWMIYITAFFLKEKVFESNMELLHFLGVTGLPHLMILSILQKEFNEKFGHITLSTDSSSPHLSTVYGGYYYDMNFTNKSIKILKFLKGQADQYKDAPLPCVIDCPACKNITYQDLKDFKQPSYLHMTHHNLYVFLHIKEKIDTIYQSHDAVVQNLFGKDYFNLYTSLREIFNSDAPLKVFKKYIPLYDKISSDKQNVVDTNKVNSFFKF